MHKTKQLAQTSKPYHTVADVRQLILLNEGTLREQICFREFDIAVLRHELAKLTTLLEADHELMGSGESVQTRWDHQVLNAINTRDWPASPIKPGAKRRTYRFALRGEPIHLDTDRAAGVVS